LALCGLSAIRNVVAAADSNQRPPAWKVHHVSVNPWTSRRVRLSPTRSLAICLIGEASGDVHTRLVGALSAVHVGATMMRNMKVEEGKLAIRLATTTADGIPVHRTLTWERAG
jgi:hypothetical protein